MKHHFWYGYQENRGTKSFFSFFWKREISLLTRDPFRWWPLNTRTIPRKLKNTHVPKNPTILEKLSEGERKKPFWWYLCYYFQLVFAHHHNISQSREILNYFPLQFTQMLRKAHHQINLPFPHVGDIKALQSTFCIEIQ